MNQRGDCQVTIEPELVNYTPITMNVADSGCSEVRLVDLILPVGIPNGPTRLYWCARLTLNDEQTADRTTGSALANLVHHVPSSM